LLDHLRTEGVKPKQPRGRIDLGRLATIHDLVSACGCLAPGSWRSANVLLSLEGSPERLAPIWVAAVKLARVAIPDPTR
jgi:hypothetical protein